VEIVALMAQLTHEAGGVVLGIDSSNAFNAVKRLEALKRVAQHAPDLYAYAAKVYGAHSNPSLLFALDDVSEAQVIDSCQGVQQGDSLGSLLFCLALHQILLDFALQFPKLSLPSFLDDLTILCLTPALSLEERLAEVREGYEWLSRRLGDIGLAVNKSKSIGLLPAHSVMPEGTADADVTQWASRLVGAPMRDGTVDGMILVGVPVGCEAFIRRSVSARLREDGSTRLLRGLVELSDVDAALGYTLLRTCHLPVATFLSRNVGPSTMEDELSRFDMLTLGALAALIQEPAATSEEATTLQARDGEFHVVPLEDDWTATVRQVYSTALPTAAATPGQRHTILHGHVALDPVQCAQVRLSLSSGGVALPSAVVHSPAAFLGRTLLALPTALEALSSHHRGVLREPDPVAVVAGALADDSLLFSLPLLCHTRAAVQRLLAEGISQEDLQKAGCWSEILAWARGDGGSKRALINALLPSPPPPLLPGLAAVPLMLPQRGVKQQAAFSECLDKRATMAYRNSLEPPVAPPRGQETAEEARMRLELKVKCQEMQAQHLSQSSPGALAFLSAPLSNDPNLTLEPGLFREAARRVLGIVRPVGEAVTCHKCGKAQSAAHVLRCSNTGQLNYRHHTMVRVLAAALTAAGLLGVIQEDVAPFVDRGFDGSMDITIPGRQLALPRTPETAAGFHVNGRNALLDITIMDPSTSASRVRSALERGHTAGKGYGKKITHYSPHFDATRHTLFPISIELFGYLHPISKQFFSAVSLYQHNRSGGCWPISRCMARWRQLISITLQRTIGEILSRNLARSLGAAAVAPDPGGRFALVDGYLRIHLLTPTRT
jgi:hypothetical protein